MKILQILPYYYPHVGGVENHVQGLTTELMKKGVEVAILTSRYKRDLPEHEIINNVHIYRAGPSITIFNTPITLGLTRLIKTIDFDIAHIHYPPPVTSYIASVGCKHINKPYCLTYHCDLELDVPAGDSIVKLYQETFAYNTVRHAKEIIVHTKSYQESSALLWNVRSTIIPSAVDTAIFNPAVDKNIIKAKYSLMNKKIVLFVGRLVPHKGIDQLLYMLRSLDRDIVLLIVGNGPELDRLKKLSVTLSLAGRVFFAENISNAELPYYYASADLFILPSITRLEAFGMVTLEAMASGKAVLVSDIPGVREIVTDGKDGLLFQPFILDDLINKIKYLFDNPDLLEKFGRNGRKKVETQFQWGIIADSIIKVYNSILENG